MKKEIKTREDIVLLVNAFYERVKEDELLAPIFNDVAKINWTSHLPVMYDFWAMVLLGDTTYKGNPMTPHLALNKKFTLTQEHFNRWLDLFNKTIDAHFKGDKAEEARTRAVSIAGLMQHKIQSI
ncbi:MAG: group III truncated hemoglobin [Flammeovirgaceae bacterium]|nr:group III truncated hemoglobin [Flammeovirgaceae bacterium]